MSPTRASPPRSAARRRYSAPDLLVPQFRSGDSCRKLRGAPARKYIYGFNSGITEYSGQYTDDDAAAADKLRGRMLEKYPEEMATRNIGAIPNNALYHAEATVLLRAVRENGGSLSGKNLIVVVDKPVCLSCQTLLPLIGMEVGNPTVTFVDPRGVTMTMQNGSWIKKGVE